jgi:hypothetical protein
LLRHKGAGGWAQRELVSDGLRRRSLPGEVGGQFINYFLSGAIERREGAATTRNRIIASSPLYVANAIPLAQVHWAVDDPSVPIGNGRAFVDAFRATGRPQTCLDVRIHPEAGHDQDRQLAPEQSRAFLLKAFAVGDREIAKCRRTQ